MDKTSVDCGVGDGKGLEAGCHAANICELGRGEAEAAENRWRGGTDGPTTRPSEGLRPLCVCEC